MGRTGPDGGKGVGGRERERGRRNGQTDGTPLSLSVLRVTYSYSTGRGPRVHLFRRHDGVSLVLARRPILRSVAAHASLRHFYFSFSLSIPLFPSPLRFFLVPAVHTRINCNGNARCPYGTSFARRYRHCCQLYHRHRPIARATRLRVHRPTDIALAPTSHRDARRRRVGFASSAHPWASERPRARSRVARLYGHNLHAPRESRGWYRARISIPLICQTSCVIVPLVVWRVYARSRTATFRSRDSRHDL